MSKVEVLADLESIVDKLMVVHEAKRPLWFPAELLAPPAGTDPDAHIRQLRERGTESEEVIQRRLQTARRELEMADRYRYQVINDDLDRATSEIVHILKGLEDESHA